MPLRSDFPLISFSSGYRAKAGAAAGSFRLFPTNGGGELKERHFRGLPLLVVIAALFYFAQAFLFRDLWFDEALTVLNFALSEPVSQIYFNYAIPNNQILYTFLLRLWIELQPAGIDPTVWLRLLSLLLGGGTLAALYFLFKASMGGGTILLPVLTATAVSIPFLIYTTALRGYMLSALLVVFALHNALRFAGRADFASWCRYAIFSLLCVGTIPSNLAVMAGVVLYALPLCGIEFYRRRKFWILAATPVAMFLLFYLPIFPQFLAVTRLGEGWHNGFQVLLALLAAFAYSYAMLLLPATGALLAFDRPHYNFLWSARAAIWLLPIPMALLLPVAPFPRVFFPFLPLFLLLLTSGIRDLTALNCRWQRRWNQPVWIIALTVVALLWGFAASWPELRLAFSRRNGGASADDYFFGYYLRPEHTPRETVRQLAELYPAGTIPPVVYLSFTADPWAIMFYGNLAGLTPQEYRFDGPRGRVESLPPGSLAILREDEPASVIEQRFRCRLALLFSNSNHGVYRVE